MRSSTSGERTVLAATYRKTYYRVKIADTSGTMQDVASLGGYNWLADVSLDFHIDQPIAGCNVTLRRETDASPAAISLSPYRTDSPLNGTGPAVTVYRRITVEISVVTGGRPADGSTDWKLWFDGVTDTVTMTGQTIEIVARDKGAYLMDQWIDSTSDLIQGSAFGGRPQTLEAVINQLLVSAPINGVRETVQVLGSASTFVVTSFPLKFEPVMTAIQRAVDLAAADFRYAWDDSTSAFRPTLTYPDRVSPVSVATVSSADIVSWQQFALDRLDVRNIIGVSYRPKNSTTRSLITPAQDNDSIAAYGRRVLTIQEADDSAIDTSTEATMLANLILADLKDPKAQGGVELLPDWRFDLNDYLTFSANKFFDIDQDLALMGLTFDLKPDSQRMTVTVRGLPSAGYERWRRRARDLAPNPITPTDNGLTNVQFTDDDIAGTRSYTWERGANVAFVAFYEALAAPSDVASAFPDPTAVVSLGSILPTATDRWVATKPPRGKQRFGIAVPYYKLGGRYVIGSPLKWIVDPLPSNLSVNMSEQNDPATDGYVDLGLYVFGSKSDWPATVEVWVGEESGVADFNYTASAESSDLDSVLHFLKSLPPGVGKPRVWSLKATNVAGEIARSTFTETVFTALKTLTFAPTDYDVVPGTSYSIDSFGQLNFSGTANGIIALKGLAPGVIIQQIDADIYLDGAHLPFGSGINGLIEYGGNDVSEIRQIVVDASAGGWNTVTGTGSYTVTTAPLYFRQLYTGGTGIKYGPVKITYFMPAQQFAI